jgi:hypothetical protein
MAFSLNSKVEGQTTDLKSRYIDGKNRNEEGVNKEPMGNQDYNSKYAKLLDGSGSEESDNSENGVVDKDFKRV